LNSASGEGSRVERREWVKGEQRLNRELEVSGESEGEVEAR
jgi:hypothetical protein